MRNYLTKNLGLFGTLMLVLCAALGIVDGSVIMAAGGQAFPVGGMNGNPQSVGVNGTLTTDITREQSPELIEDAILEEITKMRPYLSPLTSILGQAKARKAQSMEFGWYSVDTRAVSSTVVAKTDLPEDARGNTPATLQVNNVNIFNISDTIYVPGVFGSVNGVLRTQDLVLLVIGKDTVTNTLTVVAINGNEDAAGSMSVPAIAENTEIFRMGRAAAEGEMKTASYASLPKKQKNYCQIFKFQLAQSTIQKLSAKEVKWEWSEIEEQGIFEFKRDQEASAWFGAKGLTYDGVKDQDIYTTGGIVGSITQKTTFTKGQVTNEDLVDMCKDIFQGNAGNKKRILVAGSGFVAEFSKIGTVEKQMEAGNTAVAWGMEWKEIRSNFGNLLLMQLDLFDEYGFEDKAVVLDPDFVDKYSFVPFGKFDLDLKKSGEFDGDVTVFSEICGYALRYPSCHRIIELVEP